MNRTTASLAAFLLALPAGTAPAAAAPGRAAAQAEMPADQAVALDRTFLVGYWTDNDNCREVIEFAADGRFVAVDGGEGLWDLEGDALTVTSRATLTVRIVPVDENTIMVINADGSLGRSTRCEDRDDDLFLADPIA